MLSIWVLFSASSLSLSCILFICKVDVGKVETNFNFELSVFPNFLVISLCFSLSTKLRKKFFSLLDVMLFS